MGDTIEQQREALLTVYSGEDWKKRVKKMSPTQLTSIYLRLKAQGKVK